MPFKRTAIPVSTVKDEEVWNNYADQLIQQLQQQGKDLAFLQQKSSEDVAAAVGAEFESMQRYSAKVFASICQLAVQRWPASAGANATQQNAGALIARLERNGKDLAFLQNATPAELRLSVGGYFLSMDATTLAAVKKAAIAVLEARQVSAH